MRRTRSATLPMVALLLVLSAAPAPAQNAVSGGADPAAPPEPIACDGVFAADSSEARLIDHFGADNVITGEVDGPEGTTMQATTVFPDDPRQSFQVYWWDEDRREQLAGFTVPAGRRGPGDVVIGMGIEDVQALNGEPFTLSGFYWDYGGSAGFESGRLAELSGGCYLSLRFEPAADVPEAVSARISGDQQLPSDLPELRQVDVRVIGINIGYPAPEGMFEDMGDEDGTLFEDDMGAQDDP